MRVSVMALAEIGGIIAVLVGGYLVADLGGAVLALGGVLLYEARP